MLLNTSSISALILAVTLSTTASADSIRRYPEHAAPPSCSGSDKAAAVRELNDGKTHYRKAKSPGETNVNPELTAALASFEASCAAGNDYALEFRAYALAGLGRWVEAADSLDVFLATHPIDTLEPDVKARVSQERTTILAKVSSLTVTGSGSVVINHHDLGAAPLNDLRLTPGTYDVQFLPTQGAAITRTVTLDVGPHGESFDAPDAASDAKHELQPVDTPKPKPVAQGLDWNTQRIAGVVLGVAGLAAGGVGLGMALAGVGNNSMVKTDCPGGTVSPTDTTCAVPSEQAKKDSDRSAAQVDYIISGISFGVGGAMIIGGLVLFFTAPNHPPSAASRVQVMPMFGAQSRGLMLNASF